MLSLYNGGIFLSRSLAQGIQATFFELQYTPPSLFYFCYTPFRINFKWYHIIFNHVEGCTPGLTKHQIYNVRFKFIQVNSS